MTVECASLGSVSCPARGPKLIEISQNAGVPPHRTENALDALLDELQTFSQSAIEHSETLHDHTSKSVYIEGKSSIDSNHLSPSMATELLTLRRPQSYPSEISSRNWQALKCTQLLSTGVVKNSVEPAVPNQSTVLLQLADICNIPPTSQPTGSRSPSNIPSSIKPATRSSWPDLTMVCIETGSQVQPPASNSSSCESIDSQEGLHMRHERQQQLEQRHQELLRKKKALQDQYTRLQQLQRDAGYRMPDKPNAQPELLKKTGSESNLLTNAGLGLNANMISSSLSNLASNGSKSIAMSESKLFEAIVL